MTTVEATFTTWAEAEAYARFWQGSLTEGIYMVLPRGKNWEVLWEH